MSITKKVFFITSILLVLVLILLGSFSAAKPLPSDFIEDIDSYIQEQMRQNKIPGLGVGIVENGEVVYLSGFGKADSERQVTPQTPFIIGSMSKSFTALAVMQLVEAGKINLDAPIVQYIPDFHLADYAISQRITVRHLLNQTSGIPNVIGLIQCTGTGEKTIQEAVEELSSVQPFSNPGDRFQYSNPNYTTLGMLIETVSGQSYGEYVQENIFNPLEMRNSFTSQTEAESYGLSKGHRRWFGISVPSDLPYLQHAIASGYIISSAEDITHFLIANLNDGLFKGDSILSADGIAELHKPVAQSGNEYYGMGWVIGYSGDEPILWHHGSTANYHSTMLIEPETDRGIVVLTNVGLFQVWHLGVSKVIAEGIGSILREQIPPQYGINITTRYIIADVVIVLLTALMILYACLIPRWLRKLKDELPQNSYDVARRLILPIVIDLAWPIIILTAFPVLTNIPSWSFWLLYQPDLGYWLICVASLTLCKAVIRIWFAYPIIRLIFQRFTKLRLLIVSLAVIVIFFVLFLVVMFTSIDPATFVIGLLVVALLLEIIAFPVRLVRRLEQAGLPE
jgi:CubicO group peptidase (beta-lactamase class C family)